MLLAKASFFRGLGFSGGGFALCAAAWRFWRWFVLLFSGEGGSSAGRCCHFQGEQVTLMLVEAFFFKELVEVAWLYLRRLVFAVFGRRRIQRWRRWPFSGGGEFAGGGSGFFRGTRIQQMQL